jgi:hypothetical protein
LHRSLTVAAVAQRSKVRQRQPKVRSDRNRDYMICMQVPPVIIASLAQLRDDLHDRRL